MDFKGLKEYCLSKPGVEEDFPFDSNTLVFKVGGKMFALTILNSSPLRVNLKCDPYLAQALRQEYKGVIPGYHMNKKHWNTVMIDGSVPEERILWMIDMSYELVFKSLTKAKKQEILKNRLIDL